MFLFFVVFNIKIPLICSYLLWSVLTCKWQKLLLTEAVTRRCSVEKVLLGQTQPPKLFLKISQNSQENICVSGLQLY